MKIRRKLLGYAKFAQPVPIYDDGKKVVGFRVGLCNYCGRDLRMPVGEMGNAKRVAALMRKHVKACRVEGKKRIAKSKFMRRHFPPEKKDGDTGSVPAAAQGIKPRVRTRGKVPQST